MMYPGGLRVDNRPEQQIVREVDPDAERERLAELLRERRRAQTPGWQPWPAPEVPMRVVAPGSTSGGVARLLSALRSAEWRSAVTYARGTLPGARGRRGRVVGSWAVRAAKGSRRAVAIWHESGGKLTAQGVLVWGDRYAEWIGVQEFERGL